MGGRWWREGPVELHCRHFNLSLSLSLSLFVILVLVERVLQDLSPDPQSSDHTHSPCPSPSPQGCAVVGVCQLHCLEPAGLLPSPLVPSRVLIWNKRLLIETEREREVEYDAENETSMYDLHKCRHISQRLGFTTILKCAIFLLNVRETDHECGGLSILSPPPLVSSCTGPTERTSCPDTVPIRHQSLSLHLPPPLRDCNTHTIRC